MEIQMGVCAGLIGTVMMTVFTELVALMFRKPYHVIVILARILRIHESTKPLTIEYSLATVLHFAIGAVFGLVYQWSIVSRQFENNLVTGITYGFIIGCVAVFGWFICLKVHPSPPALKLTLYLSMIFIGHLVLALVMVRYFQYLVR